MSSIAAIGEATAIEGLLLAGVAVRPAEDDASVVAAWGELDSETAMLFLTARAAAALAPLLARRPGLLRVVLP